MRHGFSLVELSIVLVILGLLTGGILAGQSLIRAAELRSVSTEYARYVTAMQTFRDKYFAVAGDMSNATAFWGRQVAAAHCVTNSAAVVNANGSCDGDANGWLNTQLASQSGESFQIWRQLALAGLIEGTYTGLAGAGSSNESILGTNVPRSKISNAGWSAWAWSPTGYSAGDGAWYAGNYGNVLHFGAAAAATIPEGSVLKPEEAWNVDTKLDDGMPGRGKVMVRENGLFAGAAGAKCTTSTSNTDFAGTYNLTNSGIACPLKFLQSF